MEEAPVVVTMATGAIGPVVAKLSTLLVRREYKLRRRTRKDVKRIRSKLKSIHSLLWVIWEREDLDAEGKELRTEAWDLADDMDDAIDDFILSMNRGNDGRIIQDKTQQPSCPFKDLKTKAHDVSKRCRDKWKLFSRKTATVDAGNARKPRVHTFARNREEALKLGLKLVGMDEPRDDIIKYLVREEESIQVQPQLKMASIVGSVGVGKTTLAHLVYEAIENNFAARAFVSVTESHNMTDVLATILKQVVAASDTRTVVPHVGTKTATEKHLIDIISNFLSDKRYLVIIDDIWHWGEWETIRKCLPDNNLGSRIVTTTLIKSITEMWQNNFDALVYEINDLSDFQVDQMIDTNTKMVGEHFDGDHSIVKMCGGMPLALLCMLSALAKEQECQEQQRMCPEVHDVQDSILKQVTQNGIQNTPGFEPLVESLQLGYNDLPHHMLKTCLLYSSIYPESYEFERDRIVRRWICQGFVCKEEAAKHYYDELVSRGFIQKKVSFELVHKVNLMTRNYLRRKLREDNFITCTSDIPSSGISRRLCIDYWPRSSDTMEQGDPLSGIDWSHIRSLVVCEGAEEIHCKHLRNLRALDITIYGWAENQHLMKGICGLLRLRHLLGLCGQGITEIPAEIGRLRHLETLELYYTGITRLPAEIGDLKQLKTLDVGTNYGLKELPREMGNLQDLETLWINNVNIREPWEIIMRLKKLKNLHMRSSGVLAGLPRDVGGLQQLKNLDVSWNRGITELPREIGKLQHLETLQIDETEIAKLPRDIRKLHNLETLNLAGTKVRKLPREIGRMKKLKDFYGAIATLPFEAGQISRLQGLPIWAHHGLKNSHLVSLLAGEILSYQQSDRYTNGGLILGTKHMHVPRWIQEHFNDIGSLDIRICKLEEQDLKILREMPSLEVLYLRFEAVLRKPISISGGGFAKLEELVVDSRAPRIAFQEGAMPSLERLTFEFQFYGGPPNKDPVGIKHLVSLRRVEFGRNHWYRGDIPCISATIDSVREEVRVHPNSKTTDGISFVVSWTEPGRQTSDWKNFSAQSSQDSSVPLSSVVSSSDAKTTTEGVSSWA